MAEPEAGPLSAAELILYLAGSLQSPRTRSAEVLAATVRMLSADLATAHRQIEELNRAAAEAERIKVALTDQLVRAERRLAEVLDQSRDARPCVHCGLDRLTLPHLLAGGGHTYEGGA